MDFSKFIENLIRIANTKKYTFATNKNHIGNIFTTNYTKCLIHNVELFYSEMEKNFKIKKIDGSYMTIERFIKRTHKMRHICIPIEFLKVVVDILKKFNLGYSGKGRMLGLPLLVIPYAIALLVTAAGIGSAYIITNLMKNKRDDEKFLEHDIDMPKLMEYIKDSNIQKNIEKIQLIFYPSLTYNTKKIQKIYEDEEEKENFLDLFNRHVEENYDNNIVRPQIQRPSYHNGNIFQRYFNNRDDLKFENNHQEEQQFVVEEEEDKFQSPSSEKNDDENEKNFDEEQKFEEPKNAQNENPFQENNRNPFENNPNNKEKIEKYYNVTKRLFEKNNNKKTPTPKPKDFEEIINKKKIPLAIIGDGLFVIDSNNQEEMKKEIDKLVIGWFVHQNAFLENKFDCVFSDRDRTIFGINITTIQKVFDLRKNKRNFRCKIYGKTVSF